MRISEIEMQGLISGKCIPGDMKVNESLPAYLVRKFSELHLKQESTEALMLALRDDSRESRSKLELVTTENIAARKAVQVFCDVVGSNTDAICEEVGAEGVKAILSAMHATGKMIATDAMVNEIRAEGVEIAINHLTHKFEGTGHIGVPVMALESLASQLRADAAKDGE